MFIDTHCHLDLEDYDSDRENVISRARQSGVEYIINVGISIESSRKSIELSKKYDFIYSSIGIHPHDSDKVDEESINILRKLAEDKKVVAVGETGLDYYRDFSPRDKQKKAFAKLIELAKELKLPLIIHDRQAHDDVFDILDKNTLKPVKGVMHCFSGSPELAKRCLDTGLYISFTCNITFDNAKKIREAAGSIPLERILLETDAPYLAPQQHRGKRNEPSYIKYLAEELAKLHNTSVEEVAKITSANAKALFGL